MDTGTANNELKYFPEDELENIIADVRKKRQQKWESHLASKSLALGSSNVDHMMEIFQSERRNFDSVAETNRNHKEIEKTDFCQCIDNGCECIQNKLAKDSDCDGKRTLKTTIRGNKTVQSRNEVRRLHEEINNREPEIFPNSDETKVSEVVEPEKGNIYPIEEECDIISTSEQEIYEELNSNQEINHNEEDITKDLEVPESHEVVERKNPAVIKILEPNNDSNCENCPQQETFSENYSETQSKPEITVIDKRNSKTAAKPNQALLLPEEILFRLRNILKRLLTSIEQFKKYFTKQKPDEEDEDDERRVKRANEFVAWFSRNYLYQLKRQIDLLKNEKSYKFDDLYKKLYLAFQTTVQAIQACLKSTAHSSIAPCKKIGEFLNETNNLYDYCIEELSPSPELEKLKSITNEVCSMLEEHVQIQEKAEATARAKAQLKKRTAKQPKNNVPKKLSMYCSSSLPKDVWEKKSSKLARKKFGPPKSKNPQPKCSKVSPKPSERSLVNKNEKLSVRAIEKMEFGSETERLKINQVEEPMSMMEHYSELDGKLLQTVIENVINDDDDPISLPSDNEKRLNIFLFVDALNELDNLRGKKENGEFADCSSHEEIVKERLLRAYKQFTELSKSSPDVPITDENEKKLERRTIENSSNSSNVSNSRLICMKHDENYQKRESKQEYNKNGILSEDGKSLCIPFYVDGETVEACKRYRSEFEDYKNSFCYDPDEFLSLVERSADTVILKLIDSIVEEVEDGISLLTDKLYELELKEVCS